MSDEELLTEIEKYVNRIASAKGAPAVSLDQKTVLLGGGLPIDSLDLAGLVVELESATGKDPFQDGFVNFRTAGELVRLYSE